MKHAKPDYEPPTITELGPAEEQALDAIRTAFDALTAAGVRVTVSALLEEVRRLNQKTPAAVLNRAFDHFDKSQGPQGPVST